MQVLENLDDLCDQNFAQYFVTFYALAEVFSLFMGNYIQ